MDQILSTTDDYSMTDQLNCDVAPGHIDRCQICGSNDLQQIIDLGYSAPCDSLLTKAQLMEMERTYPLNLVRCRECDLVQIDYAVDPRHLFHSEYPYRSGITETLRRNLHGTSRRVAEKTKLERGSLVVDIGSNDGTILEGFRDIGMKVLGVEPTNIADIANGKGIETIKTFFDRKVAADIRRSHGAAALATAANVFAHVNNLSGLLHGVHDLLRDGGVFVTESHYMLSILETLQYDSIYHEHLRFYLIKPLIRLFDDHGFTLIDVEQIPNYGGSIRVYARKGRGAERSREIDRLIAVERSRGAYEDRTYSDFANNVRVSRRKLRSLLVQLNDAGKKTVGIGCPGRAVTLLTYCGLTLDLLPYIAEQSSSLKLGLYTPGTHIPVVDEAVMFEEQPEYGLILSWHYADPIVASLRKKGLKSKVIVPLPEIRILE
ncbi:MAG TPA: class I SAM-dependent methyltransferase [Candidatus Methylomirabilis sp.]|nr:class I SAM-dependent methyltransferase [Candidatus Methylomirabilis sp.]